MLKILSSKLALEKVFLGALIIILGAQLYIPLKPVPITLQSFAAMFIGFIMKPKEAALASGLYIFLGLIGFPVFSGFVADPSRIFGPTGGYLIGCILASYVIAELKVIFGYETWLKLFSLTLIASIIIFTTGIARLTFFVGFENAITGGLLPFIIPGIIKCVMLSILLKMKSWR